MYNAYWVKGEDVTSTQLLNAMAMKYDMAKDVYMQVCTYCNLRGDKGNGKDMLRSIKVLFIMSMENVNTIDKLYFINV